MLVMSVFIQGVVETGNDPNLSTCELVTSHSGPVTAEPAMKRKAETDYIDEQFAAKRMKSGKCFC